MPTLKFTDYDLHYNWHRADENAPTLVFIHDLCLDTGMWEGLLAHLDRDFNILTYDFYGHGRTTEGRSPLSLELLSVEFLALIHELKLSRIHLIGCRFSAILAFELTLNRPEVVESLTLISLPFYVQKNGYDHEGATNIQLLKLDRSLFEKKYLMESLHPVTVSKSRTVSQALRRVSADNVIAPIEELIRINNEQDFDLIGKLKSVQKPVLFLHGEYDPIFPASLAMIFSNYVFNSRFMVIPDASCLIPLDQPETAAHLLNRFIRSDKPPSPFTPGSRRIVHTFNEIIEKAYQPQPIRRRFLRMAILGEDTHVYWNGREIDGKWNQRNARELLLFMILNRGAVKRDVLIDAFTPEMDLDQARNRLRVQLNHLNQIFRSQPDESIHDLMIVSRDSIALNADVQSDVGVYLHNIEGLLWADEPIASRSESFLRFLEDYRPEMQRSFRAEWTRRLFDTMQSKLSQIMAQLLISLKDDGEFSVMRRILKAGRKVEPYKGFCDEWSDALRHKR
ncbi:alpha/beta hydrolase [Sporolactobacillus putidus]|uniref:AB hydrolase-1 domain-containing protein n=1 Tax=Sporolactobacillus putidus TaxID=492735 RepID=A0A917W1P3_9BACL|nr:alpha/beta fold hydrolase [Sporolactobacillus putidus]GGL50534.1 hypothetical protein GCM10007968_13440 [Sporolactobacillus putidus]